MNIVISDFDNTLFKRNHGLILENIDLLSRLELPVFIVSYRGLDQERFIRDTLEWTPLNVVGLVLLGDRSKNPQNKFDAALFLKQKYNIVYAMDDGEVERSYYDMLGIPVSSGV